MENIQEKEKTGNSFENLSADFSTSIPKEILNENIKERDVELKKTVDIIEDTENIFSSHIFMNSVNLRQSLVNLENSYDQYNKNLQDPSIIEADKIDSHSQFKDHVKNINEDLVAILEDGNLNNYDHKYLIETMAIINTAFNFEDPDNEQENFHKFNKLLKNLNKKVINEDEDRDFILDAQEEVERVKKINEIYENNKEELDFKNHINLDNNDLLRESQMYLKIANDLEKQNLNHVLNLYRAKRDGDPDLISSNIQLNPSIYGANTTVKDLINRQVQLNKAALDESGFLNRLQHSVGRSFNVSHVLWRDHVMTNPAAIPLKAMIVPWDYTDDKRVKMAHGIKVKFAKVQSEFYHEAGMKAGEEAIEQQIRKSGLYDLTKNDISEEDIKNINKVTQDAFKNLDNETLSSIKEIAKDAIKGKLSPIITDNPLFNKIKHLFKPESYEKKQKVEPIFERKEQRQNFQMS